MRKVTEKTAQALRDQVRTSSGNTVVSVACEYVTMFLHGNAIAEYDTLKNTLVLRDCGWTSNTTKERLNGILEVFNSPYRIYQRDFAWYITDGMGKREEWTGTKEFEV